MAVALLVLVPRGRVVMVGRYLLGMRARRLLLGRLHLGDLPGSHVDAHFLFALTEGFLLKNGELPVGDELCT